MSLIIKTNFENCLVFTHNDVDGVVAGYLIKHFFDNNLENDAWDRNVQVFCCDYNQTKYNLQWFKNTTLSFISEVQQNDSDAKISVYMLDYSIQPNDLMIKFYNWINTLSNVKFFWLDHHITAIQNLNHYNIPGLRDNSVCGAMNVWNFFKKNQEAPKFLKMISDFDTWNEKSEYSFDKELLPLNYFIESFGTTLNDNTSDLVKTLNALINDNNLLEKYISTFGKRIYNFMNERYNKNISKIYNSKWMNYSCLVVNSLNIGSMEFECHPDYKNVDLLIRWNYDGNLYQYYVYTTHNDIDVGGLCEKYLNGGGHEMCGGGHLDKYIFEN